MMFQRGEGRRAEFSWSLWSVCAGGHCTGMYLPVPTPVWMEGRTPGELVPPLGLVALGSAVPASSLFPAQLLLILAVSAWCGASRANLRRSS